MAKRTHVMASIYAPSDISDEKWKLVEDALKAAGVDWDDDWETVDCPLCGSSHDCDCKDEEEWP